MFIHFTLIGWTVVLNLIFKIVCTIIVLITLD